MSTFHRPTAQIAGALLCLGLVLGEGTARADETSAARRAAAAREMDRPYTMAELSVGMLNLPGAEVCSGSEQSCSQGEVSLGVGIHNFYRNGAIGIGAGILYGTSLRTNEATCGTDPQNGNVEVACPEEYDRRHSRKYFLVEAAFRYYALRGTTWEWWGGPTVGGVVVNDSWSEKADRAPPGDTAFVGPRATTVGTEGLSVGLGIGGEWSFASNWSFGTQLRYSMWFLPSERERSPTGDLASLSGRVDMFDLGLSLAYRIAL